MNLPDNRARNKEIIRRHNAGELPRQIAPAMGLTKNQVIGVLHRAGLSVPGRSARCVLKGEECPNAKLSAETVRYIRTHYVPRDPDFCARGIARQLGFPTTTVEAVLSGRSWSHIQ